MAVVNNIVFNDTYNKLLSKFESKVHQYSLKRKYGGKIDYYTLKKLVLLSSYLDSIKNSNYDYYHVNNLTDISNYLNKI